MVLIAFRCATKGLTLCIDDYFPTVLLERSSAGKSLENMF